MDGRGAADDAGAVDAREALVAEAHAEDGDVGAGDELVAHAGARGVAGPGGDDHAPGGVGEEGVDREGVVGDDEHARVGGGDRGEELAEVPGEGVVVVEEEDGANVTASGGRWGRASG